MPSHPSNSLKLNILVVEDDLDDVLLLETALKDNEILYDMRVVSQGDKLMPHLLQCDDLPHIMILDFNLPVKHGREILQEVKAENRFNSIPIIVLTTSSTREDMEYAYAMGARKFFTKPTSVNGFNDLVNNICSYAGFHIKVKS